MQRIDVQNADTSDQMRVWFFNEAGNWVEIPWLNPAFFQNGRTEEHGDIVLYLGTGAFVPVRGWWHVKDLERSSDFNRY